MAFKAYYQLTKPGIIYANLMTAVAGFIFGSYYGFNAIRLTGLVFGLGLIIASGCVINNVLDRKIDSKMKRTAKRATVTNEISVRSALIFAAILGVGGILLQAFLTNLVSLAVSLIGLVFYVAIYGYAKRKTPYGTLVGSISGAIPPVSGYAASRGFLDIGAIALFVILVCWQMVHFFGIALYRQKEYEKAGIPIWPAVKGLASTKIQIKGFLVLFFIASLSLFFLGYTNYIYLGIVILTCIYWIFTVLSTETKMDQAKWGRKVFLSSLSVLIITSIAISIGPYIP